MSIAAKINNLQPKTRRNILVVASLVLLLTISVVLGSVTQQRSSRTPRAEKPEVTVVAPARTTGVEQFAARMGVMERQQDELKGSIGKLVAQLENREKERPLGAPSDTANNKQDEIPELGAGTTVFDAPAMKAPELPPPPPVAKPAVPTPGLAAQAPVGAQPPAQAGAPSRRGITIISESGVLNQEQAEEKLNKPVASEKKAGSEEDSAFIPAGSMFTGVMLNGLDAPTSAVAQKNPVPVVLRVKREAVLPNFASLDVRECFLMVAGYGQLSSERAMMRSEALSCVRNDGKVIESKLEAYIVGTDGKVGVPGVLVSKQGQMIAQTLLAGTLGGIGQALNRTRVPSLNIDPSQDRTLYQADSVESIAQSGVAGGVSSATNMIAKFYLDMAKETFPVVEVPAGEAVTVIVTRGAVLPLKGSTNLQKYHDPAERKNAGGLAAAGAAVEGAATTMAKASPAAQRLTKVMDVARDATAATTNGELPSFSNGLGW